MASKRKNPETELQNQIMNFLNQIPGVRCWRNSIFAGRMPSGGFYRAGLPPGSSDLILCVKGNFVALEVKCPGKDLDEDQISWGKQVTDSGGIFACVRSIKDALTAIESLLKETT